MGLKRPTIKEGAPCQYAVGILHDTENGIRYEIQAGIRIPCRTTGKAPNPVLLHYTDAEEIGIDKGNDMIIGTDKKLTRTMIVDSTGLESW